MGASLDYFVSETARGGAEVELILRPADYDAGIAIPAAVVAAAWIAFRIVQAVDAVAKTLNLAADIAEIYRTPGLTQQQREDRLKSLVVTKAVDIAVTKIVGIPVSSREVAIALSDVPMREKIAKIALGVGLNLLPIKGSKVAAKRGAVEGVLFPLKGKKAIPGKEIGKLVERIGKQVNAKLGGTRPPDGALGDLDATAIQQAAATGPQGGQTAPSLALPHLTLATDELFLNGEFLNGLEDWLSRGALVSNDFPASPSVLPPSHMSPDGLFAVVHTGLGDASTLGYIEQQVTVPLSRNGVFSMLYNFLTSEYPDWVGSEFNDYFQVSLVGPSGELTLTKAEFLNSTSFTPVSGLPGGILDNVTGGQTGWKIFNQGPLALKQGVYVFRVEVRDVSDAIFDSAILIDRVSLK